MNDNPLLLVAGVLIGGWIFGMWWGDLRAAMGGAARARALPGAVGASWVACAISGAGALVILAGEVVGENMLGISGEQSVMTGLFAVYSLVAAFVEELIFRGFIVVKKPGVLRWLGVLGASVAFALAHPFLWSWEESFVWAWSVKGAFSTGVVFVFSLWLYAMRFAWFNKGASLIPCVAGHLAKNVGVIAVKGACGFLGGVW